MPNVHVYLDFFYCSCENVLVHQDKTSQATTILFFYSHHLPAWQCHDIVRSNFVLIALMLDVNKASSAQLPLAASILVSETRSGWSNATTRLDGMLVHSTLVLCHFLTCFNNPPVPFYTPGPGCSKAG